MKKKSTQKCKFLFENGSCRMGERCFYSHVASTSAPVSGRGGKTRGGMSRGYGGGRPSTTAHKRSDSSGKDNGSEIKENSNNKPPARLITLKRNDIKTIDLAELESQVKKIYSDLNKLDPLIRVMGAGKSLDMMFIIDCTSSMLQWIDACKKEIKSIIDHVRNQHLNIKINLSIVAYRDHSDGELV